jgi:hypothetical protein
MYRVVQYEFLFAFCSRVQLQDANTFSYNRARKTLCDIERRLERTSNDSPLNCKRLEWKNDRETLRVQVYPFCSCVQTHYTSTFSLILYTKYTKLLRMNVISLENIFDRVLHQTKRLFYRVVQYEFVFPFFPHVLYTATEFSWWDIDESSWTHASIIESTYLQ